MNLERAIQSRHMVRAFTTQQVDEVALVELLDLARRAPSAGNTAATHFVLLTGDQREVYWSITLPSARREGFTFPTLPDAGALVLVTTSAASYADRYSEDDKAGTGLGDGADRWPVPFWWVDAGAVIQNLLLLTRARSLGACLFGVFDHEAEVAAALGIPSDVRIVAAIAIGHPDPDPGPKGRSASRPRPPIDEIVHRGGW